MAPEVIDRGLRGYSYPVSPCYVVMTISAHDDFIPCPDKNGAS